MIRGSSALATTSRHAVRTGWLPASGPAGATQMTGQFPGPTMPAALATSGLPRAGTVLAVTARPGPESNDLGALLYAFGQAGARLALLSLTRGEASPVNSTRSRLEAVRPWELQLASWSLGVSSVAVADYPDGGLRNCQVSDLTARVQRAIAEHAPDVILVLDPATGDSDDAQVARAVCLAAQPAGVPVAARTIDRADRGWLVELGDQADAARAVQRSAARAHASQSEALPEVLAGLDRLGSHEQLRWLFPDVAAPQPVMAPRAPADARRRHLPLGTDRAKFLLTGEAAFEPPARKPETSLTAISDDTAKLIVTLRKAPAPPQQSEAEPALQAAAVKGRPVTLAL